MHVLNLFFISYIPLLKGPYWNYQQEHQIPSYTFYPRTIILQILHFFFIKISVFNNPFLWSVLQLSKLWVLNNFFSSLIEKLYSGEKTSNYYYCKWNLKNSNGSKVSSGIYFITLESKSYTQKKKLSIVK